MEHIVQKTEAKLGVPAASTATPEGGQRRELVFQLEAETLERQLKRAVVQGRASTAYELYCDEGAAVGGDDTAPTPLMYFSAGIAF